MLTEFQKELRADLMLHFPPSCSPSSPPPSQDFQQGTALAKQTPWDINSISSAVRHCLSTRPDIIMSKINLLMFPGNGFLNLFVKAHLANFILFKLLGLKGKSLKVVAQLCKSGNCKIYTGSELLFLEVFLY